MVVFLHDINDKKAGADMGRLHDTRTLHAVRMVEKKTIRSTVFMVMETKIAVVVPAEPERITDTMLTVLTVLGHLEWEIYTVADYLQNLQNTPAAVTAAPPTQQLAAAGKTYSR